MVYFSQCIQLSDVSTASLPFIQTLEIPESLLVFLLELLQVGGAEVKLGAGGTADGVLVVSRLRTLAQSGLDAERRHICGVKSRAVRYRV